MVKDSWQTACMWMKEKDITQKVDVSCLQNKVFFFMKNNCKAIDKIVI